jgi:hypothetical protein
MARSLASVAQKVCGICACKHPWRLGIADDLVYKRLTHFLGRTLAIVGGNEGWGFRSRHAPRFGGRAHGKRADAGLCGDAMAQGVIDA